MENKKIKILFIAFLALLLLPLLQQLIGFPKIKGLKGAITEAEKPTFALSKWFDGNYQEVAETYLNEKFGFRNHFIQLNNQIDFSLFEKINANGVIVGKKDYLFELSYIKAYYGSDFVGKDSIDSVLKKFLFLQDKLEQKNISLILVLNPGKGSYYPEYIPDKYKQNKSLSNYEYYAYRAKQLKINLLDLKSYFINQKNSSPYPLFTKCGIHWSYYCEILAEDTLMDYIGSLRQCQTPQVIIDSVYTAYGTKFRDADIMESLNLFCFSDCKQMAYPIYQIDSTGKSKLNCITISDSFYWGPYGRGDALRLFANNQFWYYYKEIYNPALSKVKSPSDINLLDEIEKQQVIIIMATEATLPRLGWGFIEDAYTLFQNKTIN